MLKARDVFFFRHINTKYPLGGLFPIRKDVFLNLDTNTHIFPKSYCIESRNFIEAKEIYQSGVLGKKIICKPIIGLRGQGVEYITNENDLQKFHKKHHEGIGYIMQEFIDYPIELGVFYRKNMDGEGCNITIAKKEVLCVFGNGRLSLRQLIEENNYVSDVNIEELLARGYDIEQICPEGKLINLKIIYNNKQSAQYYDLGDSRTTDVVKVLFDQISKKIGLDYGRYDVKIKSLEDFRKGKKIYILEANGITSIPLEIYDVKYSFFEVYKKWYGYLESLYEISMFNKGKNNVKANFLDLFKYFISHLYML